MMVTREDNALGMPHLLRTELVQILLEVHCVTVVHRDEIWIRENDFAGRHRLPNCAAQDFLRYGLPHLPLPKRVPVTHHICFPRFSAQKTRSGVSGRSVIRMPVARNKAFPMAGATGVTGASPIPFAPYGPSACGTSTIIGTIDGTSKIV